MWRCAYEPGDFLGADSVVAHEADERGSEFAGCPGVACSGGCAYSLEHLADVGGVEGGAVLGKSALVDIFLTSHPEFASVNQSAARTVDDSSERGAWLQVVAADENGQHTFAMPTASTGPVRVT